MRTFDLAPLYRSTVGFDRLFSLFDQRRMTAPRPGYPPYNIERTGENDYRVTVAVAGFAEPELNIEVKENTLTITRRPSKPRPKRRRARRSTRASPRAPSSACSSSPTTSR